MLGDIDIYPPVSAIAPKTNSQNMIIGGNLRPEPKLGPLAYIHVELKAIHTRFQSFLQRHAVDHFPVIRVQCLTLFNILKPG